MPCSNKTLRQQEIVHNNIKTAKLSFQTTTDTNTTTTASNLVQDNNCGQRGQQMHRLAPQKLPLMVGGDILDQEHSQSNGNSDNKQEEALNGNCKGNGAINGHMISANNSGQPQLRKKWNIQASVGAKSTINPIREVIEMMDLVPNPNLSMIPLSIGRFI